MEISLHSHLESNIVIATKFCTWYDSCAVVACAKICRDLVASNGIAAIRSFHRIWIAGKKTLEKRAPAAKMNSKYTVNIYRLALDWHQNNIWTNADLFIIHWAFINRSEIWIKNNDFHRMKCILNCRMRKMAVIVSRCQIVDILQLQKQ